MCVYRCVYRSVYRCVYSFVYRYVYMCVYVLVCLGVSTGVCTGVYTGVCVCAEVCIRMCTGVCTGGCSGCVDIRLLGHLCMGMYWFVYRCVSTGVCIWAMFLICEHLGGAIFPYVKTWVSELIFSILFIKYNM